MNKVSTSLLKSVGVLLLVGIAVARVQAQAFAPPAGTQKYAFFPQGGNFFSDLFPNNFVDLNSGSGIGDWHCTNYTYNGHLGIDTGILGFAAQAIGVPIFAVLDGTVVQAHDGEFDMNTGNGTDNPNFVRLSHGNGLTTLYLHMKKNSVAVSVGQQVKAGQQIGLTGSSGLSSSPHLHFQSAVNGVVFEPFAGNCRTGTSNWVSQPPFRTDRYLRTFVMTQQNLNTWAGFPFDTTRTGTFTTGTQPANLWFLVGNGQAINQLGVRFLRPDGTENLSVPNISVNGGREASYKLVFNVNFDVTGTWKVELSINQQVVLNAPIQVVSPGTPVTNTAPTPVTGVMDPASDGTMFCRITSSPILADADYDFVSYHYVWKVNGAVVRDVVSAGLADAIPRDAAKPGDNVTCIITPTDGKSSGSSTVVSLAPQLLNIATRMRVQSGDNALIGGFTITGNTPKKVIIRGIGPSLSAFFSDALADPTLELFQGSTSLQTNNDWKSDQQAEIEATGVPPENDVESAIVRTLPPGAYTAVLKGNGGAEGIGVVEVYDLDQAVDSKLANISSRGFVETDNGVMVGGLIVGPVSATGNAKIVVRALGPSLANFGIDGAVQDPTLDLVNANGVVLRANDNWKLGGQEADLTAAELAPSDDRESALIETVGPGAYTAIVRGSGNTTGVGLVEIYNITP